jgi:hypothetical protein
MQQHDGRRARAIRLPMQLRDHLRIDVGPKRPRLCSPCECIEPTRQQRARDRLRVPEAKERMRLERRQCGHGDYLVDFFGVCPSSQPAHP